MTPPHAALSPLPLLTQACLSGHFLWVTSPCAALLPVCKTSKSTAISKNSGPCIPQPVGQRDPLQGRRFQFSCQCIAGVNECWVGLGQCGSPLWYISWEEKLTLLGAHLCSFVNVRTLCCGSDPVVVTGGSVILVLLWSVSCCGSDSCGLTGVSPILALTWTVTECDSDPFGLQLLGL